MYKKIDVQFKKKELRIATYMMKRKTRDTEDQIEKFWKQIYQT